MDPQCKLMDKYKSGYGLLFDTELKPRNFPDKGLYISD